jgi:sporulation protein YlmC with PRC-barrel domain
LEIRVVRLELGKPVHASDDSVVGELADVVIDPVKKRVTHLVVKPHGGGGARLVSIELAQTSKEHRRDISLRCGPEELESMPNVEDFAYLRLGEAPVSDPEWDVGVTNVLALPYYESAGLTGYGGAMGQDIGLVYDRVPKGEVEIRRTSSVVTGDGKYIGDVDGFLVDEDDHITHFVLERGHLWGRREVTVPIGAVAKVESDTVTVDLSEDEIGKLPAHKVHRWPLFGGD